MKFCSYFYYYSNQIRIKTRCKKEKQTTNKTTNKTTTINKQKKQQTNKKNQGNLDSTPPYVVEALIDKRKLLK